MADSRGETTTGGRPASNGVIPGDLALSVGRPEKPAPSGWRWVALTEVARLETGHTPSRRHPEYWGGDVPWIGIKDATSNHGRVLADTIQHTNALGIANSSARILPANTVCLSRTASVGYVVVMGRPMATSQDFVNWVCSEAIDYRFLKYVLLGERAAFLRFASGTTHQTIYFPEVKAFHVCLPPVAEQGAIASILGALDDKIELNRRMNETLETIAQVFFSSWLAELNPLRTKVASLVEASVLEIGDGYRAKNSELGDEGLPFIRAGDLSNGFHTRGADILRSDSVAKAGRKISQTGDVAFTSKGTIGRFARVSEFTQRFVYSPQVCFWRSLKPSRLHPAILYCWMQSDDLKDQINAVAGQTDMAPYVSLRDQQSMEVPEFPESHTIVGDRVEAFLRRAAACDEESRTLTSLRDTLLPKLISGELRVKDAERFVGAAI
jgi:type I restriction enzyme, S subunit